MPLSGLTMIKVAPKAVGIAGRNFDLIFRVSGGAGEPGIAIVELPPFVQAADTPPAATLIEPAIEPNGAAEYAVPFSALRPGRGVIQLRINDTLFAIPAAVFRPREFFVVMVLSSNHHDGWDPLCYLFGNTPEQLDLEGDAWIKLRQLEKMYHMRNIPVTWLIDDKVAAKAAKQITEWHTRYGDDYGVLPSSHIHHTAVNLNFERTASEVTEFVNSARECTEHCFDFFTTTFAVDQWIGSVGGQFTEAAYRAGLNGLWGVGFDHRTCDTSMYHRGCPWDVYKPHRENFRIPAGHPSTLWMFQWTTRDALLAMHSPDDGPSGSVIFSTDPDDQRVSGIMSAQPDYWPEVFRGYRANFAAQQREPDDDSTLFNPGVNDFFCFLVHQEDHDCHFPENADFLRRLLDSIGDTATYATMEEVSAWLNLKYAPEQSPTQVLYLEDHLRCHDAVVWYGNLRGPEDWPSGDGHYPPGILFYSGKAMWCCSEGDLFPWRFFNYAPRIACPEDGAYPERDLRQLAHCTNVEVQKHERLVSISGMVEADADLGSVPLVLWHVLRDGSEFAVPRSAKGVVAIRDCLVLAVRLTAGHNVISVSVDLDELR